MDLATGLNDHLKLLVRAGLDQPAELVTTLAELAKAAAIAVPSFCGLQLSVVQQGCPITVTVLNPGFPHGAHLATLLLPLRALGSAADGHLTLYARNPGAFVDLAADLSYALRLPDPVYRAPSVPAQPDLSGPEGSAGAVGDGTGRRKPVMIILDAGVPSTPLVSGIGGWEDLARVNQAIGVLVDQGWTPAEAETRLQSDATAAGLEPPDYARTLLDDLVQEKQQPA